MSRVNKSMLLEAEHSLRSTAKKAPRKHLLQMIFACSRSIFSLLRALIALPLTVIFLPLIWIWSLPFRLYDLYFEASHPFLAGDAVGRFLLSQDRSVTFWDMFCAFRHGGLSRTDSLFNAFYIRLSEKAHRRGRLQKSVRRVPSHPSGWFKKEELARRRTLSHFILSIISALPAILSYVPSHVALLFRHAAQSMENSHKAFGITGRFLKKRAAVLIPLCFAAIACSIMIYFASIPLTYAVRVDGKTIGYIESREELNTAVHEVESSVSEALGCSFKFPENISYSLDKVFSPKYLSKTNLIKALSSYTQDYVKVGYALYIDDKLAAASENEAVLRNLLNTALQTAKSVMSTDDLFILNNTRITYQNCPADAFLTESQMQELLVPISESTSLSAITLNAYSSESASNVRTLSNGNAYSYSLTYNSSDPEEDSSSVSLFFGQSRIEETVEKVPFNITYRESDTVYVGAQYVYQKGVEGEKRTSYQIYFSGSTEYSRTVVSEAVTKDPIDQIVLIGTKELPQNGIISDGLNSSVAVSQHCFIPPVYGTISSYFGLRDLNGDGVLDSGHTGVDIPAPYGTPVYAGMSGVVVETGPTGNSYGTAVKILHPNGLYTFYAHLSAVAVRVGQTVSQNQMIGNVGTTGYVTGPHVHFEVLLADGKTQVNPLSYLIGY